MAKLFSGKKMRAHVCEIFTKPSSLKYAIRGVESASYLIPTLYSTTLTTQISPYDIKRIFIVYEESFNVNIRRLGYEVFNEGANQRFR